MPATGRCLCGAVRYTIDGPLRPIINCHCHRCRQWTGHHMAASQCAVDDLSFEADGSLRWFAPSEDPGVVYGFCATCGGSLFWRTDASPDAVSVCAGPLAPPTGLATEANIWLSEVSDYHVLDPSLPTHPRDSDGSVALGES